MLTITVLYNRRGGKKVLNRIVVSITRMQSAANLFVNGILLLPIICVETLFFLQIRYRIPGLLVLFGLCPLYNLGVSVLGLASVYIVPVFRRALSSLTLRYRIKFHLSFNNINP